MSELVTAPSQPCPSKRSRVFTREVWRDRLARFPLSGLTPAQFCALEAVSLPSFYSWKRRLAAEALSADTSLDHNDAARPRLLPVRLHSSTANLELVLTTGLVLRIPPGCDTTWVRSLVTALGGSSC
jgi:hypothetical protein